jgi:hypothetical protein
VQQTYFNPNGFQYKKDLPPIAVLAKNILEEKENQSNRQATIRQQEKDKKKKIENTMLAFSSSILPAADGCHPDITIGTKSNKLMKFDSFKALQRDMGPGTATDGTGETMVTMPSMDDEHEDVDNDDDSYDYNAAPFGTKVDEDGTRHYTTADGKKDVSFKKNAPQNGKLCRFSSN